jgi:DNA modification methylase
MTYVSFVSSFATAHVGTKEQKPYFRPDKGLYFIPDNDFRPNASVVTNVPPPLPSERLRRANGTFFRKSENSIQECLYVIATYCTPGGVVIDDHMGTGVSLMASLRLGRRIIAMDKFADVAEAGLIRAKRYALFV